MFHDIISGRRQGAAATVLRGALGLVEPCYAAAVGWRNRRYDRGAATVHRVGVPVLSVGNLTLGGTGKTPMVRWLAQWFHNRGVRVAVVSRGYGAKAGSANDEALELRRLLPDVPHLENPDRVAAARQSPRWAARRSCWTMVFSTAASPATWTSSCWTPGAVRIRHVFPRGTLASRSPGCRAPTP